MKTAVIGVGRMGQRHIHNAHESGMEIVGICDQNPDSLEMCNRVMNIPKDLNYTDARKMLIEKRPDCVIISTTSPMHCEYTCMAAESGVKYILCEKPMATSLVQCHRMIKTCDNTGSLLAINHQMRFMEQYIKPKNLIYSDIFGGLCSITVVAGNFGLAMNGTHYFEMFRYMSDEEPDAVTAWFSDEKIPNPRGPQFEDRAGCVRVTTRSGKRLYIDVSSDQGHGVKVIYTGRYGQIIVDELAGKMNTSHRMKADQSEPTTRYGLQSEDSAIRITPADALAPSLAVLNALIRNEDHPDGNTGQLAVKTLLAAYISDENGHIPVKIDETEKYQERAFPWA